MKKRFFRGPFGELDIWELLPDVLWKKAIEEGQSHRAREGAAW
jgi:hypothetical protein